MESYAQDWIEDRATELANRNRVEEAWRLRGLADALLGGVEGMDRIRMRDPEYGRDYREGFRAVVVLDLDGSVDGGAPR